MSREKKGQDGEGEDILPPYGESGSENAGWDLGERVLGCEKNQVDTRDGRRWGTKRNKKKKKKQNPELWKSAGWNPANIRILFFLFSFFSPPFFSFLSTVVFHTIDQ